MSIAARVPLNLVYQGLKVSAENEHASWLATVAKDRDRSAFRSLFDYYSPRIYKYFLKNRLSESVARDCVQDVMSLVWLKAHLFDVSKGKVSTWIFTIARNVRFDFLRKQSRDDCLVSSEDIWHEQGESFMQPSDLEEELSRAELRVYVEQLPDPQREVIQSVYFMGQTQEEYAKIAGVPLGTVKSRIRLAMKKLNKVLGEDGRQTS